MHVSILLEASYIRTLQTINQHHTCTINCGDLWAEPDTFSNTKGFAYQLIRPLQSSKDRPSLKSSVLKLFFLALLGFSTSDFTGNH